MLFLSVLSRISQATKLYHLSLWLPPCSRASLAIFQFWVKWFIYVYNFETVNFLKRTKLILWIIILVKNIKGFSRSCFLKPAAKKKKIASVIPLMIAVKTAISIRGEEREKKKKVSCYVSHPNHAVLCFFINIWILKPIIYDIFLLAEWTSNSLNTNTITSILVHVLTNGSVRKTVLF